MCKDFHFLVRMLKRDEILMNRKNKFRFRSHPAHPSYVCIKIFFSLQILIIPYNVARRTILPVLTTLKELNDLPGILKPFIIIYIQEPFAFGGFQTCVSRLCKVITPVKRNNKRGIPPYKVQRFIIFPRKNNDQFTVQFHKKRF